jgi:hypothetical protein
VGEKNCGRTDIQPHELQAAHCKTHVRSLLMALFANEQASEQASEVTTAKTAHLVYLARVLHQKQRTNQLVCETLQHQFVAH